VRSDKPKYPGTVEDAEPSSTQGSACFAQDCPMHGSISTGTSGARQDWLCWLHFGKDAGQWQSITTEINRVQFLADATRILRHGYGGPNWPHACRAAKKLLLAGMREDLVNTKTETAKEWMLRLEAELASLVRPSQKSLTKPDLPKLADTWQKVVVDEPA
jgi:hypothetical protein